MSPLAERSNGRGTATAIALVLTLLAGLLTVGAVTAPPARALHQHCGDDLEETGSLTNGHPDTTSGDEAWGGVGRIHRQDIELQNIGFARIALGGTASILDGVADIIAAGREITVIGALVAGTPVSQVYATSAYTPAKVGETALRISAEIVSIADLVLFVVESTLLSTQRTVSRGVADEDACGGTMLADTMQMAWVSIVQRNLASTGPPLAVLMTPHRPAVTSNPPEWPLLPAFEQGDFAWCPPIPDSLRGELPASGAGALGTTGGDCVGTVHQGFLDAPDLGVQAIVTSTIAHLVSHGVDVRDAQSLLTQGDTALRADRYRDAFHHYRAAYQRAMELTS